MKDEVFLTSTQVLTDLKSALLNFDERASSALLKAESEVESMRSWMEERRAHWLRRVDLAEQQLSSAEAALSSCESSGYYDDEGDWVEPDCSSESNEVDEARRHLESDSEQLRNVESWAATCEVAIIEYQKIAGRFRVLVLERNPAANSFLDAKSSQYGSAIGILSSSGRDRIEERSLTDWGYHKMSSGSVPPQPTAIYGYNEQKEWADRYLHPKLLPLSISELDSLAEYQGDDNGRINTALREDNPRHREIEQRIREIDSAIQKSSLPVDLLVYRGCLDKDGERMRRDELFYDKAFLSTSLSYGIAKDFNKGTMIEITVPKGTKGIYMDELKKPFGMEAEILLPRNLPLLVTSRGYLEETYFIKAIVMINEQ